MPNDSLHDGLPSVLNIDNLANGAAYEMLGEAFKRLAANIGDPNTDPTQVRGITLSIKAKPYKDRSGAELSVKVDTKLVGLKPCDAQMFVARRNGEYLAFGKDSRQTDIEFDMQATVQPESMGKPS